MMTRIPKRYFGIIVFLSLLMSGLAQAGPGGMTDEQMQQMMHNAQKMQECMSKVDPSTFSKLEEKGKKMQAEVKALCDAGKRGEAQKKAIAYGKEMNASKEMKEMQKCGMMAGSMIQQMPIVKEKLEEGKGRHICDDM